MNAKQRRKAQRDRARRTPNARLIPMDFSAGGLTAQPLKLFWSTRRGPTGPRVISDQASFLKEMK